MGTHVDFCADALAFLTRLERLVVHPSTGVVQLPTCLLSEGSLELADLAFEQSANVGRLERALNL